MPADNVLGWRKDTLALLLELDSPVYRWPGGNFVSGYDWKDGIGDRDRRPPRKNPAWKGIEPNDVGLHEFMDLMREIGSEPYVAVNTGAGGPEAAAALVEYANGAATTPMGGKRAENGSSRPFGVKLWAVGNEMYGDWQIGHMPLEKYVEKHRKVVDAMRAVDPKIEPVAVGAVGDWSRTMLGSAASHMAYISEHLYWQDRPDVPAHVAQAVDGIRKVAEAHRAYRRDVATLKGKDVRIALDEWNYWYGPNEYGELGTRYFLQDGLGIAAGLHELFREQRPLLHGELRPDRQRDRRDQDHGHRGGDGGDWPRARPLPAALRHASRSRWRASPAPLDVAAAWTADRSTLTVAVVNPSAETRRLKLDVAGAALAGTRPALRHDRAGPVVAQRPRAAARRDDRGVLDRRGRRRARRPAPQRGDPPPRRPLRRPSPVRTAGVLPSDTRVVGAAPL